MFGRRTYAVETKQLASTSRGVNVNKGRGFGTILASDTRMAKGAGTLLAPAVTGTALVDRSTINPMARRERTEERQDPNESVVGWREPRPRTARKPRYHVEPPHR